MTHASTLSTRSRAEQLLAVAEQAGIGQDFGAPFLAVARVLRAQDRQVEVFSKTIKHPGGLIGCMALLVDGDPQTPLGYNGADNWSAILKAAMRERGYRRGKFLGQGQSINPMPDNEFLQGEQEDAICCLVARLRSHEEALRLEDTTSPAARVAPRRSL